MQDGNRTRWFVHSCTLLTVAPRGAAGIRGNYRLRRGRSLIPRAGQASGPGRGARAAVDLRSALCVWGAPAAVVSWRVGCASSSARRVAVVVTNCRHPPMPLAHVTRNRRRQDRPHLPPDTRLVLGRRRSPAALAIDRTRRCCRRRGVSPPDAARKPLRSTAHARQERAHRRPLPGPTIARCGAASSRAWLHPRSTSASPN